MRVRIVFLQSGQVVKTFDREVLDPTSAKSLAKQIAADSGISHDEEQILFERRCKILLKDAEGKAVEVLETCGLDDEDALKRAAAWSRASGVLFATAVVAWR